MAEVTDIYEELDVAEETFRDHLSTVDKEGKRIWIYPKKPKGRFTNYRSIVNYTLLIVLLSGPFIYVGGQPLLLLNILERKFVLFGQVFWPQDFYLFVIGMLASVVFIILFTVVFGRIFCGWVCPQTIFMEGVFRKIEYWIEGDYMAQKKLDKQPWTRKKILKKGLKHLIFLLISSLIMHTFLAYVVGAEEVWEIIYRGPVAEFGWFIAMIILTLLFYGVFAWMREQVCTTICPYGRLQGVLLDRQSIVVAYDHERGEERAKFRKNEDRDAQGKGDCIECNQCVYVCPTGIDIRNGTQLECINCTACIDACDSIMDRIEKPRGLVRYASEQNISEKLPFIFAGRMKAYTAVLIILMVVMGILLFIRTDFDATILRTPGMLYNELPDGRVSNLYQVKLMNKSEQPLEVRFELIEPKGQIQVIGEEIKLNEEGIGQGRFFIIIDPKDLDGMSQKIKIGIFSGDEKIKSIKTKFLGPAY